MLKRFTAIQFFALGAFLLAFAVPSVQIFLTNLEANIDYGSAFVASGYFTVGAIAYVVICTLALISNERAYRLLVVLLLALFIGLVAQFNFFVWDYGVVDGSRLRFADNSAFGYLELAFWIATFVACWLKRRELYRHRYATAQILIGFALVSLAPTLLDQRAYITRQMSNAETLNPGLYAFSKDSNVVVWISDGLQSDIARDVLERRPDLAAAMRGFTFYAQAMGHYKFTTFALPTILSGTLFEGAQSSRMFRDEIAVPNNMSQAFARAGFQTDMVSSPEFCVGFQRCNYMWSDIRSPGVNVERSANLINIALFRITPHVFKPLVFDGVNGVGAKILDHFSVWSETQQHGSTQTNDVYYYNQVIPRFNAGAGKPTFKVLHSYSTHHPYVLQPDCTFRGAAQTRDAVLDQAECNISLYVRFLEKLRDLDVYDQTLVVWISDHGARQTYTETSVGEYAAVMADSAVTFAIKPMHAEADLTYVDLPVQLLDIAPTLYQQFGIDADGLAGTSIFALNDSSRTRYFYDSTPMTKNKPITFRKYRVAGNKSDADAWTFEQEFTIGGLDE